MKFQPLPFTLIKKNKIQDRKSKSLQKIRFSENKKAQLAFFSTF
jgi:hypothetical protein